MEDRATVTVVERETATTRPRVLGPTTRRRTALGGGSLLFIAVLLLLVTMSGSPPPPADVATGFEEPAAAAAASTSISASVEAMLSLFSSTGSVSCEDVPQAEAEAQANVVNLVDLRDYQAEMSRASMSASDVVGDPERASAPDVSDVQVPEAAQSQPVAADPQPPAWVPQGSQPLGVIGPTGCCVCVCDPATGTWLFQ